MNAAANWTLHHVGVAVAQLDKAIEVHERVFGQVVAWGPIDDPIQRVSACFMRGRDRPLVELVAPIGTDSPLAGWLSRQIGAYHVCYEVDDVDAAQVTGVLFPARAGIFSCTARPGSCRCNVPRYLRDSEEIPMEEIWTELERKLGPEAGLGGPATEESIRNLEQQFSSELPESYLASLKRHDGVDILDGFELLTIDGIIETRQGLLDQLYAGKFDDRTPPPDVIVAKRIDRVWWNAAWIPFARHAATGRLLFLDLDPWQHGIVGQILEWDSTEGPLGITADSFEAWLKTRMENLNGG